MRPWSRPEVLIREAGLDDCDNLADIHASAFRRGWSGAEFEALLLQPGVRARVARLQGAFGAPETAGFILYRAVRDEAEILSLATTPQCRRRGVAQRLIEEALRDLYRDGVRTIHLEVEDTNAAAIGLYAKMEFEHAGARPGYYAQGRGRPGGAVIMTRRLR
jgi:ribosomal-protein-alanine N-acetyltransferase